MASTYYSAATFTMAGTTYDPIECEVSKDNAWSPTYQARVVLATRDLVAPTLKADRNLITNPSAALDLFDAVGSSCTLTRQAPASGFGSAHGTAYRLTGTGNIFGNVSVGGAAGAIRHGMVAGGTYTASGTFFLDGAMAGSSNAYARSIVVNVVRGGVQTILASSAQAPNAGPYQTRLAVSWTIPADATQCWIEWYHGHASTSVCYWTDLKLSDGNGIEPDGTNYEFWDGDTIDTTLYNYDWAATPHRSWSQRSLAFVSTGTTPVVDPRVYPRVNLKMYTGSDGLLLTPTADIIPLVRSYVFDDVDGTVTLTLAGDEVRLQDYANVGDDFAPGAMLITDMISYAMRKIGVSMSSVQAWPGANATIPATATIWRSGQTLDDWLLGAIRSQGYELWYNARNLITTPWQFYPLTAAGKDGAGLTAVSVKAGANVIESGFGIDVDAGDYADAVVLAYSWTDAAGASQRKTYYSRPAGAFHKVKTVSYPSRADPGSGQAGADSMRAFAARAGWTNRLTIIAQGAYRPDGGSTSGLPGLGSVVYIQRADGSAWKATLNRITYSYPADTMELGITNVQPDPAGPNTTIPIPGS